MQTLSRRGRVSDGGQMTFPFLKVTKFPNDVLFFHRISLQALYCVLLYTQSALESWEGGVSPQPPPVCSIHLDDATAATGQRSPHASYKWKGERVIEPIKWIGIIRRPWLTRASGGNLARTPGLYRDGIFKDHRESGPRFIISSERQCFLIVYCPRLYTGAFRTQTESH